MLAVWVLPMLCRPAIAQQTPSPVAEASAQVDPPEIVTPTEQGQAGPRALSRAFRAAAAKATPSVVTVFAYGQDAEPDEDDDEDDDDFDDRPDSGREDAPGVGPVPPPRSDDSGRNLPFSGLGSGVVLSAEGLIVTNHHVVANAQRLVVQTFDQSEWEVLEVSADPASDLAVLRIDPRGEPLTAATLGDSDSLEIGDWVLAIGSPFELEATVSAGIISAQNRTLRHIRRGRMLQTDAAINPGNSGGALIDLNGDVIGINTAMATRGTGYIGIGFAIPINQARWIADELAGHGRVRRATLGLRLADLNKRIAAQVNLPAGLGVLVYQVIGQGAAAQAGIRPLDVIVEFAGEKIRLANDLQEIVERKPIGSRQPMKVIREGQEIALEVLLAPIEDPTDTGNGTNSKTP